MDYTPPSPNKTPSTNEDSGCPKFEETSEPVSESTPMLRTRKRKAPGNGTWQRKLANLIEACPGTPQFSSTLNESLTKDLEEINLGDEGKASKFFKGYDKKLEVRSAPTTPEKQIKSVDIARKPSSSFVRSFAATSINSPLKESHDILYPTLQPHEPYRKSLTPCKLKKGTPAKKCLFKRQSPSEAKDLFPKIVSNGLIMANIFSYLSNGDLYRVVMASGCFLKAVMGDSVAKGRYLTFVERHKKNKENYMITPPSSPEKEEEQTGGDSPRTLRFKEYFEIKKELTQNQTLMKCVACGKPAIVDNFIAQCHNAFCGHIYCQKCGSFAKKPEDFFDKCGGSFLLNNTSQNRRRTLDDLSNSTIELSFGSSRYDSGIGSEQDSTQTPDRVKRNLSKSFGSKERPRVLFDSNHIVTSHEKKPLRRSSILPVMVKEERRLEFVEPPSPPKVKSYAACSKQSKRNLKRLTR